MTNLSLLAAEAGSRGPNFAAPKPVDLPGAHLLSAGYVCLAQEGGLSVALQPARGMFEVMRLTRLAAAS